VESEVSRLLLADHPKEPVVAPLEGMLPGQDFHQLVLGQTLKMPIN